MGGRWVWRSPRPNTAIFDSALATAIAAGVTRVPLTFTWLSLEPDPDIYDDRNLAIAALVIPAMGVSIDLAITPMVGRSPGRCLAI